MPVTVKTFPSIHDAAAVLSSDRNARYLGGGTLVMRALNEGDISISTVVRASDQAMSFAAVRLLGGLTFSLGLALVIVGGAELFTGNNLIVMAWASGKVSTREMLRNWVIVYFGNFVGSLGLVFLVFFTSPRHERRSNRIIDIEHKYCKDSARCCVTVLQGSSMQRAGLSGGLACACWPYSHRQNSRPHIAGLRLHSGWLRALRCQHVFSAVGLAVGSDG